MATEVARLRAYLDADTDQFTRSIRGSESAFSKFGHAIKVGALAAGAAIGTGLAVSAKVGFDEFREGQRVAAQTEAALKSTGGAANVTAGQIDALATSIMNKTGIDDEAIKSGSNLLLTFTKIRNEAGKGNDIFNQATMTVQDMSVAFDQSARSSAIQLGKALNDPIAGLTSLARIGVQFTDQQKEQIKTLVEHGDTLKAQKIILAELNKETGGSAVAAGKTFDGQMNILKETFKNTAGEIVGRFLPGLVKIAQFALPLITKGIDFVADAVSAIAPIVKEVFTGFFSAVTNTSTTFGRLGNEAYKVGQTVRDTFKAIWEFIKENVVPIILALKDIAVETFRRIMKVVDDNRPALERIADRLGKLIRLLATVLLPIIKVVFQEVLPRVLNAAIVIIDNVSGAIEKVVGWFKDARDVAKTVWGKVKEFVQPVLDTFKDFRDVVQSIIDKVKWLIDHIPDIPHLPKEPGWSKGGLLGDGIIGAGIGAAASTGLGAVSPTLYDDYGIGQAMGLTLSSGYRPGAVTSTGNPSLHGMYPSKAIDMAGSESAMRQFFLAEVARGALTGLREVIHSPFWWHPGSGITRIPASAGSVLRDHYSHVHVGSYDQGGFLRPGWNLAYNGLGRPEPVGMGNVTLNYNTVVGDPRDGDKILRLLEDWRRRGGR